MPDLLNVETPSPLAGGKNPCRRHLYQAVIQSTQEQKTETRKHPNVIPSPYLDFLTHAPTTIIPVAHISRRRSESEFVRVVELPVMTWHRWVLQLPASAVAINRVRHSCVICRYLIQVRTDTPASGCIGIWLQTWTRVTTYVDI